MNLVAIFQLATFVIDIGLLLHFFPKFTNSVVGRALLLLYLALSFWAISDFLNTISPSPQSALFWEHVTEALTIPVAALILRFTVIVIYPNFFATYKRNILYFLPIFIISYFALTTNYFSSSSTRVSWGWEFQHETFYYVLTGVAVLIALGSVALCFISLFRLNDLQKKQMKLFIAAFLIPIIGGALSEVIAPAYGVVLPPLTTVLFSITGMMMAYAIKRYDFLSFSSSLVLDKIFNTMKDIVLVIDHEGKTVLFNSVAETLTGFKTSEIIDQPCTLLHKADGSLLSVSEIFSMSLNDSRVTLATKLSNRRLPVSVNSSYLDAGGTHQGIVLVARDMTSYDEMMENIKKQAEGMALKIVEIQKLNDLMIDRELKMIELKKRNAYLESIVQ